MTVSLGAVGGTGGPPPSTRPCRSWASTHADRRGARSPALHGSPAQRSGMDGFAPSLHLDWWVRYSRDRVLRFLGATSARWGMGSPGEC